MRLGLLEHDNLVRFADASKIALPEGSSSSASMQAFPSDASSSIPKLSKNREIQLAILCLMLVKLDLKSNTGLSLFYNVFLLSMQFLLVVLYICDVYALLVDYKPIEIWRNA